MKIALCLSGYVGSVSKFHAKGAQEIDIREGYGYLRKNVIQDYDVDIFIHSWDINRMEEIIGTYNPCLYQIEPQIQQFKVDHSKFSNSPDGKVGNQWSMRDVVFQCQSQKYSRMKSVELKTTYEKANNFEYDYVFLSRFDLAFMNPFPYDKKFKWNGKDFSHDVEIKKDKVYAAGNKRPGAINDFYYLTDSKKMNIIGDLYNHMEAAGLGRYINIHHVEYNYLVNMKNLPIEYLYTRPWGDPVWNGDIRLLRTNPNIKLKK